MGVRRCGVKGGPSLASADCSPVQDKREGPQPGNRGPVNGKHINSAIWAVNLRMERRPSAMSLDVELLISHLSGPLDPADRSAFRHAAETALAASNGWGEGLVYRTIVALWRGYFRPPPDGRRTAWDIGEDFHGSKLTRAPALKHGRDLRFNKLKLTA
jgi:hypothetical protein